MAFRICHPIHANLNNGKAGKARVYVTTNQLWIGKSNIIMSLVGFLLITIT